MGVSVSPGQSALAKQLDPEFANAFNLNTVFPRIADPVRAAQQETMVPGSTTGTSEQFNTITNPGTTGTNPVTPSSTSSTSEKSLPVLFDSQSSLTSLQDRQRKLLSAMRFGLQSTIKTRGAKRSDTLDYGLNALRSLLQNKFSKKTINTTQPQIPFPKMPTIK